MEVDFSKGASPWEVTIRLFVAIAVGGLIGWDRQRSDKPAGLRTHMLVALGAATFTLLGFEVGEHLLSRSGNGAGFDPTRVLQGVVGGIGFLGAGAIIQDRGRVSGITTAASVWVSGALGAAAGVGAFVLAGITTVLALFILIVARLEGGQRATKPPTDGAEPEARDATRTSGTKVPAAPPP